jgi:environmental stress-induced protein Ves
MPWKNGGGLTEEIECCPQVEAFAWRLSRAQVDSDGPFSSFPGYDRLLVVTEGEGIELNAVTLRHFDVHRFSGDVSMNCRLLAGRVWDFGLIFDRERVAAEMKVVEGPQPITLDGDTHYLFAASHDCDLDGHKIRALETVKKEGGALFRLNKGRLIVVTLQFLDKSLRKA